jgi:hypothetical protein
MKSLPRAGDGVLKRSVNDSLIRFPGVPVRESGSKVQFYVLLLTA